jgi:hypothetical protein
MRPTFKELISGVNKTIMISAMPIVQQSGDMKSLWELATASRLLSYLEERAPGEGGPRAPPPPAPAGRLAAAGGARAPPG